MIASVNQKQFPSSFAPLGDLLKDLMFLLNLGSILSPHHRIKGLLNGKVLPRCGRKRAPSDSVTFSLSPLLIFVFALLVCYALLFWVSLILCITLFNLFLFVFFSVLVYFFYIKIKKKIWKIRKIQKQCVFIYIGTYVPWMAIETKFYKLCIFCSLDEHIYAQLSKWALWLVFVMSKIK